jgi:hypothetical protein
MWMMVILGSVLYLLFICVVGTLLHYGGAGGATDEIVSRLERGRDFRLWEDEIITLSDRL